MSSIIDISEYEEKISLYNIDSNNLENSNNANIKEIYASKLKEDIKTKIEDKGYLVSDIKIDLEDNEEYTIKKIELKVSKNNKENENAIENKIEIVDIQVKIGNDTVLQKSETTTVNTSEEQEIKKYISQTYEVKEKNIYIN